MTSSVHDGLKSVLETVDPGEESTTGCCDTGLNRTNRDCWVPVRNVLHHDRRGLLGPREGRRHVLDVV